MNKLWVALLSVFALNAQALELKGVFKQGGLVAISYNAENTKKITINGDKIELTKDGFSYYPIGRADKKITLKQTLKNGTVVLKNYDIEVQKYDVQHVKGVKQEHVTPDPKHLARIEAETKKIIASRTGNSDKFFTTTLPEFIKPADGVETGVFGSSRTYNGVEKSWHKGLDLANKEGTLVVAPLKGKVVLAMKDSFYNGNLLIIDHGKKIYSIYAHLYDIIAKNGDIVEVGDPVGLIGTTGRSTGPHLHWGVYVGQQAIDPKFLLKNN